ncbi:hypothetical protein A2U01_0030724, partial [Trifolium medium]|nr:hypothetical protein [Trifolium medium]
MTDESKSPDELKPDTVQPDIDKSLVDLKPNNAKSE